jgi:exodeoxyribonuclease V alpha subunit
VTPPVLDRAASADPHSGPVDALGFLAPFVAAGVFAPADVHVARTVERLVPGLDPSVALAVALAVRATRLGHVCVVLAEVPVGLVIDQRDGLDAGALPWPRPEQWAEALRTSAGVAVVAPGSVPRSAGVARTVASPVAEATPGGRRPLVFDGERLYLDRYWRYEVAVAEALLARAATEAAPERATQDPPEGPPAPEEAAVLDRLFPSAAPVDQQRVAAAVALRHGLAVIAGGPGTGKTRTIARLLAAAFELAAGDGQPLDIALAAPTGKAAARMTEAIHHEVATASLPAAVAAQLRAVEATTIHRLLGWRDGVAFRHDRHDPLTADIVVVDEASMVSLPLMAKLLDAVRADARLVLVGDPHQLASIEAGAVLGDLVGGALDGAPGPLAPHVVVLDRIHRYATDSPIAALADAVRTGRTDDVLALLRRGSGGVRWVEPTDPVGCGAVEDEIAAAASTVVRAGVDGDAQAGLAAARDLKVLAAVRRGPNGTDDWHERIERLVHRAVPQALVRQRWYPGRPVIVTRNDHLNALVNGDTGLVVQVDGERRVAFTGADGVRWVQPSQLGALETWWAMTVHKSQGSEYRRVVVALPDAPSPVLTRELLYTAVTRAREEVVIVASEASLRTAVGRPVVRATGLRDRLWP